VSKLSPSYLKSAPDALATVLLICAVALLVGGCGKQKEATTAATWTIDQQIAISSAQAVQAEIVLSKSNGETLPTSFDKLIAIAKEKPCEIWDDAELGKLTLSALLAKDSEQIRPYRPQAADHLDQVVEDLPECD
jgi:ABC-type uncharacterized transport system auxiliary subunit